MRTLTRLAAATITAFALTACGSANSSSPVTDQAQGVQKAPAVTASAIAKKLQAAKLGLSNVVAQTEETDPNNLLGRPNGYTSRASGDLPGGDTEFAEKGSIDRGLVIETFKTTEQAAKRSTYIQELQKGSPALGSEWHYPTPDGLALVRVSGKVKPSLAKKVQAAVSAI